MVGKKANTEYFLVCEKHVQHKSQWRQSPGPCLCWLTQVQSGCFHASGRAKAVRNLQSPSQSLSGLHRNVCQAPLSLSASNPAVRTHVTAGSCSNGGRFWKSWEGLRFCVTDKSQETVVLRVYGGHSEMRVENSSFQSGRQVGH